MTGPYQIVEGIAGTWHYHLAPLGWAHQSLCGKRTMPTTASLNSWGWPGHPGHIRYHYCTECEKRSMLAERERT